MRVPDGQREQQFSAVYARHYAAVLAYARRRADEATARDVAAETFLIAWRRQDPGVAAELPWLYRTAGLVLKNHERGQRRQQRAAARLAAEPERVAADPAEEYLDASRVHQALDALSEQDRELLLLSAWEHLGPGELAQATGRSRATTAVRLHRARRRFEAALISSDEQPSSPRRADLPHPSREAFRP
jgi:RNA polymerase sigma-70 factor, ECF subfamily